MFYGDTAEILKDTFMPFGKIKEIIEDCLDDLQPFIDKVIPKEGSESGTDFSENNYIEQIGGFLNLKIIYLHIQSADTLLADTSQKPNHTEKEFLHMKSLFEELGGKYERQGDYLMPCLTVFAEEEQPIGTWG